MPRFAGSAKCPILSSPAEACTTAAAGASRPLSWSFADFWKEPRCNCKRRALPKNCEVPSTAPALAVMARLLDSIHTTLERANYDLLILDFGEKSSPKNRLLLLPGLWREHSVPDSDLARSFLISSSFTSPRDFPSGHSGTRPCLRCDVGLSGAT